MLLRSNKSVSLSARKHPDLIAAAGKRLGREGGSIRQNGALAPNKVEQGPNRVDYYPRAFQELLAIAASL